MKYRSWLAGLIFLGGCQFGDNLALRAQPDGGVGSDVIRPIDGAIDTPTVTSCTLVPQSGCSGSTPACDVHDDGMTFCRGVTSMGTSNNHCAADTECKTGYSCIDDGVTGHQSWCARFCTQDSGCLGTGSRCVNDLTNGNGDPIGVSVCSNACDPVAQTGCPTGMGCQPYLHSAGNFTDCVYMGNKLDGQVCNSTTECSPGSVCVGNATNGYKCAEVCATNGTNTCASGMTCEGFGTSLTIGTTIYGYCGT